MSLMFIFNRFFYMYNSLFMFHTIISRVFLIRIFKYYNDFHLGMIIQINVSGIVSYIHLGMVKRHVFRQFKYKFN